VSSGRGDLLSADGDDVRGGFSHHKGVLGRCSRALRAQQAGRRIAAWALVLDYGPDRGHRADRSQLPGCVWGHLGTGARLVIAFAVILYVALITRLA
jgi:hypothetical protein